MVAISTNYRELPCLRTRRAVFTPYRQEYLHLMFNGCGGLDSNQRPSGYEPDELPTAPPRVVPQDGLEPSIFRV